MVLPGGAGVTNRVDVPPTSNKVIPMRPSMMKIVGSNQSILEFMSCGLRMQRGNWCERNLSIGPGLSNELCREGGSEFGGVGYSAQSQI